MARSKLQTCLFAAGLLTMLAGCASTPPSSGLGTPEPPCDVICHFLRLFELDQPPPAPSSSSAAGQHAAVIPSKARHTHKARVGRQARLAQRAGAPASAASVASPAPPPGLPSPAVEQPAVERKSAEQPAPISAAAALTANPDDHPIAAIPGSPAITPPWFEPLSPLHLRTGEDEDPAPTP